jgi:FkbM family methyltransferase
MKELTLPNGEKIYCIDKMTALYVYEEIFIDNVYLQKGIKIKDNDIIFDVGANIGLFSSYAAENASSLRIFTFEPIPEIFSVLKANLKNVDASFRHYNIGLGEKREEIEFFYYPHASADSTAVPFDWDKKIKLYLENYEEAICEDFPAAQTVPESSRKQFVDKILKRLYKGNKIKGIIRPLSDIIKENNLNTIDLLKIDAENYEKQVLMGIQKGDWVKIQQISMEVHEHIKGAENLLNEISDFLNKKGFKINRGTPSRETKLGVYMLYAKR